MTFAMTLGYVLIVLTTILAKAIVLTAIVMGVAAPFLFVIRLLVLPAARRILRLQ